MAINTGTTFTRATVPTGTKVTPKVDLQGGFLGGVITPASLTSTTLTFTVGATEDDTFVPLTDTSGAAISYTVASSKAIGFPKDVFASWRFVVLNFGTDEVGDKIITLMIRAN